MKFACVLCVAISIVAVAQLPDVQAEEVQRKRHAATKLGPGDAVRVDGKLDEAIWETASEVEGFQALFPPTGKPAPVSNKVRVVYDRNAIYFGARLERIPGETLGVMPLRRDEARVRSDAFGVKLDVTFDGRTSYIFSMSVNNRQLDKVLLNAGQVQLEGWDGRWDSATSVHKDHWIAEIRIPFAVLGLPPGSTEIGVQYIRSHIGSRSLYSWWTFVSPSIPSGWTPHYGLITGLTGVDTGRPYTLVPYIRGSADVGAKSRDAFREGLDAKVGIDANVRLGSTIWGGVSVLPDFGEIDLDDVVLNLDSRPLLLPEKRPFFLTGLSVYDFGHDSRSRLFATRRIGLDPETDVPLPLLGGLKIFGRSGPIALGLLNVLSEEPRTNWHVGRIKYQTEKGTLGVMSTAQTGLGAGDNANLGAVGMDGDANLMDNKLRLGAAVSVSGGDTPTALSTQAIAQWRGARFRPSLTNLWIEQGYSPPTGFLRRPALFESALSLPYFSYGKAGFRSLEVAAFGNQTFDDTLDQSLGYQAGGYVLGERRGVSIFAQGLYQEEVRRGGFTFAGRAPVEAGTYVGPRVFGSISRANGLEPFLSTSVSHDVRFGGDITNLSYTTQIGAIPWVLLNATANHTRVSLPGTPAFWTHQFSGGITVSGSPSWTIDSSPRYQNDAWSGLARLKWRPNRQTLLSVIYQNVVVEEVRAQTGLAKLTLFIDGLSPY